MERVPMTGKGSMRMENGEIIVQETDDIPTVSLDSKFKQEIRSKQREAVKSVERPLMPENREVEDEPQVVSLEEINRRKQAALVREAKNQETSIFNAQERVAMALSPKPRDKKVIPTTETKSKPEKKGFFGRLFS